MIGDRQETDGDFAGRLGVRFGLVRSGVTPSGVVVDPPPTFDAPISRRWSTSSSRG